MIHLSQAIEFDAAHKCVSSPFCNRLHGHRFKAEFFVYTPGAAKAPKAVDPTQIPLKVYPWIKQHWHQNVILWAKDEAAVKGVFAAVASSGQSPSVMAFDPTAQNLADFLLKFLCPMLLQNTGVTVDAVRLWDGPNSYAEAKLL